MTSTVGWAQPTGFIKLDDGPTFPGGVIRYTFEPNEPILSTIELTFTETVPTNTTFDAASSDPSWAIGGCLDGSPAGTVCRTTVTVGSGGGLPAFAVRVPSPAPSGLQAIHNTVFIETGGQVFQASRSTPVDAAPDMILQKDDVGTSAAPGSLIEYTLDYRNDGTQGATGVVLEETVPAAHDLCRWQLVGGLELHRWSAGRFGLRASDRRPRRRWRVRTGYVCRACRRCLAGRRQGHRESGDHLRRWAERCRSQSDQQHRFTDLNPAH